ncbi:DUF1622 domain-containing protein [Caulobacter segnis]
MTPSAPALGRSILLGLEFLVAGDIVKISGDQSDPGRR